MSVGRGPTRRAVLLGALVGVAAAACRPRHRRRPAPAATPDAGPADRGALAAALADDTALLARYDAAIATGPAGSPAEILRGTHAEHVLALRTALGVGGTPTPSTPTPSTPSPSPSASPVTPPTEAELRTAEADSSVRLGAAAVAAQNGHAAALLASISAAHGAQSRLRFVRASGVLTP